MSLQSVPLFSFEFLPSRPVDIEISSDPLTSSSWPDSIALSGPVDASQGDGAIAIQPCGSHRWSRTMDDLSRLCCPNSDCPEHGKRGAGNLTVTSRYGSHQERRMLRGSACKARFSEREGTPLFDSRRPPEKVESVLEPIAEGCGVRQTGRLCKVNRGAVGRLSRIAGEHARDLHDELVALSPPDPRGPVR